MVEYYDWSYARTQAWNRHIKRADAIQRKGAWLNSSDDWTLQEDLRVIDKHEAQWKAQRAAQKRKSSAKPVIINKPSKADFANQFYRYVTSWSFEGDIEHSTGLIKD